MFDFPRHPGTLSRIGLNQHLKMLKGVALKDQILNFGEWRGIINKVVSICGNIIHINT